MRLRAFEREADLLEAISQCLHEASYAVEIVSDARASLHKAMEVDHNRIILGNTLPGMKDFDG